MRGFAAFMRKELVEIVRTWRIWVLPGIVLFVALSGPPLAKVTPQILAAVVPAGSGVTIEVPDPTYVDSYAQWVKNLTQMVTFALVIMYGGLVSGERRSGTATLVLTKPLSRSAFVVAKTLSASLLVSATTIVGAALTWALTLAVFGEAPAGLLAEVTASWLAGALLLVAIMALLSTLVSSQAGAAGIGFGVLLLASIAGIARWLVLYTPVGLASAPARLLAGEGLPLGAPLVSAGVLAVACVVAAAALFARQEL